MAAVLATAVTTTGAQTAANLFAREKQFQAYGTTSAGAGACSVDIEGTIDGQAWTRLGTLNVTLATTVAAGVADAFVSADRFLQHRANVKTISGTGAAVTVVAGG